MKDSERLLEEYRQNFANQSTANEGGESAPQATPRAGGTYSLKRQLESPHDSDYERPGAVKRARTSRSVSPHSEGNCQSPSSKLDANTTTSALDGVEDPSEPGSRPENQYGPQGERLVSTVRAGIEPVVLPEQRIQLLESRIMIGKTDLLECMRKLADTDFQVLLSPQAVLPKIDD